MNQTTDKIGIVIAIVASFGFAFSNAVLGLAYEAGSNPLTVSLTRFFLPILLLVVILRATGRAVLMPRREGITALILGIVTASYTIALLTALKLLPVGIAILIFYLFPIFTAIIVATLRWAPLSVWFVVRAIVAFTGLSLALGVRIDDYGMAGILAAIYSGFGLAIVSAVSGRVISSGNAYQTTLYMAVGALVTFLVIAAIAGGFVLPATTKGWIGMVLAHLFYAGAMIGYFVAIAKIGAASTTIFSNLEPIVAIVTAFFVLGQALSPLQLLGALIVVAALYIATRGKPAGTGH